MMMVAGLLVDHGLRLPPAGGLGSMWETKWQACSPTSVR